MPHDTTATCMTCGQTTTAYESTISNGTGQMLPGYRAGAHYHPDTINLRHDRSYQQAAEIEPLCPGAGQPVFDATPGKHES